jgi:hypothetical protein
MQCIVLYCALFIWLTVLGESLIAEFGFVIVEQKNVEVFQLDGSQKISKGICYQMEKWVCWKISHLHFL